MLSRLCLWASSPGHSGGGAGKGRRVSTTSLEFEFRLQFPRGSPSTELLDFRQSAWSGNEPDTRKIITNDISTNQHFTSTFSMQIFKFQKRSYMLFFLFRLRRQSAPGELPRRLISIRHFLGLPVLKPAPIIPIYIYKQENKSDIENYKPFLVLLWHLKYSRAKYLWQVCKHTWLRSTVQMQITWRLPPLKGSKPNLSERYQKICVYEKLKRN